MQVLAGILGTAINTFAPRKPDEMDVLAVTNLLAPANEKSDKSKSSSDDDETLSTIHSDDSKPYKEAKKKQQEKRKRKAFEL